MNNNHLAASLRSLARNKFQTAVNILGLVIGFAATILIALFVRDELTYEHWLPAYQQVYRLSLNVTLPGDAPNDLDISPPEVAQLLEQEFPGIAAVARLAQAPVGVRNGAIENEERVYWADANIFSVLPLKMLAGDPSTALSQPDAVVLTRAMARKYFGRDLPVGEKLELFRRETVQVTAVLEDLPSNTHLDLRILLSGHASHSLLAGYDRQTFTGFHLGEPVATYFRLQPGSDISAIENELPAFALRRVSWWKPMARFMRLVVTPISDIHTAPALEPLMRPRSDFEATRAMTVVALLILLIATLNFVNLMTARAFQREVEVGVRKLAGAKRLHLICQFIGESLLLTAAAMIAAIALVELSLSAVNAFLDRTMVFDYWRDLRLMSGMLGTCLLIGLLAGIYPALVLSAFRPAAVLRGELVQAAGSIFIRRGLVILQFAALIGLIFAAVVVNRQTTYALGSNLNLHRDAVLMIRLPCDHAFKTELRKLAGVRATTCSQSAPMKMTEIKMLVESPHHPPQLIETTSVDLDFFSFYGLRPVAGRLFTPTHAADASPRTDPRWPPALPALVLNETAARQFGFDDPGGAIGQTLRFPMNKTSTQIVGVVQDFAVRSVREPVAPAMYVSVPAGFKWINVRVDRNDVSNTLKRIQQLWKRVGDPRPLHSRFLDEHIQSIYLDLARQAHLFAIFCGIALLIACTGLLGLTVSLASQRTREIGIRKAMGADRAAMVRMLLRNFTAPVLWANLIAWPVAFYLMNRWLEGFAYRIELQMWTLPAAGLAALLLALMTVLVHALRVAGAKPIEVLRHE